MEVSLPGKFRDPEGGPPTYTAESLNPEVAAATVSNGRLWVDGRSPGLATVFVTAADSGGLRARLAFKVRVAGCCRSRTQRRLRRRAALRAWRWS